MWKYSACASIYLAWNTSQCQKYVGSNYFLEINTWQNIYVKEYHVKPYNRGYVNDWLEISNGINNIGTFKTGLINGWFTSMPSTYHIATK